MKIFHDGLKSWMDLYRHCVYPGSCLKYAFSIYKTGKIWQTNRGIPAAIVTLSNLYNSPWVVLLQCTAFQWWLHGSRVSYWRRREFPKYTRLNCDRICVHWQWSTLECCLLNILQVLPVVHLVTPPSCVSLSKSTQTSVPGIKSDIQYIHDI